MTLDEWKEHYAAIARRKREAGARLTRDEKKAVFLRQDTAGDGHFPAPPVYSGFWTVDNWIDYIDRDGFWTYGTGELCPACNEVHNVNEENPACAYDGTEENDNV